MAEQSLTKLILALDLQSAREASDTFRHLRPHATWFKIGSQLFTAAGAAIVREIVEAGGKVFLDLKFHDIPNTVAAAGREATKLGVSIFNVHASGGEEMMRRTSDAVRETAEAFGTERPRVIAVTVLTSHNGETLAAAGFDSQISLEDHVLRFAEQSRKANLDGVVASVHEAAQIKERLGSDFLIVAPGVRLANASHDDQRRVASPADAARVRADYIVVGRAILNHHDPVRAIEEINAELQQVASEMRTA